AAVSHLIENLLLAISPRCSAAHRRGLVGRRFPPSAYKPAGRSAPKLAAARAMRIPTKSFIAGLSVPNEPSRAVSSPVLDLLAQVSPLRLLLVLAPSRQGDHRWRRASE